MRLPGLVPLVLAAALAACGADDDPQDQRARLVDGLAEDLVAETDGTLGEEAARCVAGRLADDVGVERFDEVVAAAAEDDHPALRDQVIDAFAACDALAPLVGG